ncbi:MAG: phosphatidyl inositol kinase [Peltula sp. TS41687]|nr:MAG: phosphatidyl inositol kinase [Peltula sp. TS41687]
MPRRPATSGYARIVQVEDESEDDDPYDQPTTTSISGPTYAPIQPRPQLPAPNASQSRDYQRPIRRNRRTRSNSSGVDIKAINARLERWAEEIASKFKIGKTRGKGGPEEEQLEIHHSVFQPPDGVRPVTAEVLDAESDEGGVEGRMTKDEFDRIVESVRIAIESGTHPKRISQGSSGSYFARNARGEVVGVFKPKDEEPYASRNPKWTKWIHRNLFPCFFGRSCLIPNLSYVSEAAAYVLDARLSSNLVPYTGIVHLASNSFYYDFWERTSFWRGQKPLPPKVGSFQVFLKGYKDANIFLREHPWPDQHNSGFRTDAAPKRTKPWQDSCRPRGTATDDVHDDDEYSGTTEGEAERRKIFWTDKLRQAFREELEKLVILDYIMRNTDRGLDNWMIKVDPQTEAVSIVSEPLRLNGDVDRAHPARPISDTHRHNPYRLQEPMAAARNEETEAPAISIGAIDNSLSWPWKHPDAWRSFPFGWLFLPVSLIGQPFSKKSREHFLPLLTSTKWWIDTKLALRRVFSQDSDFKERMFAKQMAVMKGQAYNVVETLKCPDHGPLELTRRARVYVWDDLIDVPVAVPLRAPSPETRRRRDESLQKEEEHEEMDISTANASSSLPQYDLLGLGNHSSDLPNPNRFVLPRASTDGERRSGEQTKYAKSPTSPATVDGIDFGHRKDTDDIASSRMESSEPSLYKLGRWKSRSSLDERSQKRPGDVGTRRSRYSFVGRRGSRGLLYDDDDIEGDIGYAAAAEGMEKKVIVERLEQAPNRNPVFTWC